MYVHTHAYVPTRYQACLVIDLAFTIQGNAPTELPERILGCVQKRFVKLDNAVRAT